MPWYVTCEAEPAICLYKDAPKAWPDRVREVQGYVSEEEAGQRLAQVVSDPAMDKSGTYWSWSNEKGSFENQVSEEVSDGAKGQRLWEVSEKLVGLA